MHGVAAWGVHGCSLWVHGVTAGATDWLHAVAARSTASYRTSIAKSEGSKPAPCASRCTARSHARRALETVKAVRPKPSPSAFAQRSLLGVQATECSPSPAAPMCTVPASTGTVRASSRSASMACTRPAWTSSAPWRCSRASTLDSSSPPRTASVGSSGCGPLSRKGARSKPDSTARISATPRRRLSSSTRCVRIRRHAARWARARPGLTTIVAWCRHGRRSPPRRRRQSDRAVRQQSACR